MKILIQLALIVVLALVAKLGIAQFAAHAPEVPEREVVVHVPEVEVLELTRELRTLEVHARGRVVAPTRLTLAPEVAGRVLALHPELEEGAHLAAGTELVSIDPADLELAVEAAAAAHTTAQAGRATAIAGLASAKAARAGAEAGLDSAEAGLLAERTSAAASIADWKELNEGEPPALVSHAPQVAAAEAQVAAALGQLETAQAQIEAALAQIGSADAAIAQAEVGVRQAELALSRATVRLPFDGQVVSRSVEVGQRVDPMAPLCVVQRDGWPEARVSIPLAELAHMELDFDGTGAADVVAELSAEVDGRTRRWLGRGRAVAPQLDERNPVVHLLVRTEAAPGGDETPPTPGMFLSVRLRGLEDQPIIAVPRSTLQPDGRLLVARPVDEGSRHATLEQRAIEVLQLTATEVLVAGGLEAGELLITTPPPVVVDGMRVATRPLGAPAVVSQPEPEQLEDSL